MLQCYDCPDVPGVRECGRCRHVLKYDLVRMVLDMDRVYLTELNRNKNGRPSKTDDPYISHLVFKRYNELKSYRKVGQEFSMSKDTVRKIVKQVIEDMEYVI